MIPALAFLLFLATPDNRVDASLYVAAIAWDLDPDTLKALAEVESNREINPRRYGTGKRWGNPPRGRRWRICGLMQLRGGLTGAGGFPIPACELLTQSPELSAWYGAAHLAGWRKACGRKAMLDAYNTGKCSGDGTFTGKVNAAMRAAQRRRP